MVHHVAREADPPLAATRSVLVHLRDPDVVALARGTAPRVLVVVGAPSRATVSVAVRAVVGWPAPIALVFARAVAVLAVLPVVRQIAPAPIPNERLRRVGGPARRSVGLSHGR